MKAGCLLARVRSAVLFGLVVGCTRDPSPAVEERSEFAMEFARRFCAVQTNCPCDDAAPLPDCERFVESVVSKREATAKRNGLVYDEECAQEALARVDWLGTCEADPQDQPGGPPCPVYTKHRDVGEECTGYSGTPLMSDCRAGLECLSLHGVCFDLDDPRFLSLGEMCSGPSTVPGHPEECGPGLICDLFGTGKCVALPPIVATGGTCTSELACAPGDYCRGQTPDDLPSTEAPGVCTPATTPLNAACEHFLECEEYWCIDGICFSGDAPLCFALDSIAATG